ncbi:MAG TPA: hypothetical protein VJ276_01900 [Thermoanaerobaculia bacterium]|nr:hypothetical protein [Thermoanaerobaculia bacterium]
MFAMICRLSGATVVYVPATTSPRYDFIALLTATNGNDRISPGMLDAAFRLQERETAQHQPMAITPPSLPDCSWKKTADASTAAGTVVEISSPVRNPYAHAAEEQGVFVRISDSGRPGARWYWMPLSANGQAVVAPPLALPVHDG